MLTVLLATRNRASILREVLESYCRLESPASGWNLVVVDNHSTDSTIEVLEEFRDRLPLRFVEETSPGKNAALNTGLELLKGDLVVLTDDDAFPAPNWLVEIRKAADREKEYTIFGGSIEPRWEVPPPDWIAWINDPGPIFTVTDQSLKEGPIESYLVFGPNMAIRASVFNSGVRFDCSIGPNGTDYPMGSETELVVRLERSGHKSWHVKNALVQHFIRKEQLEKSWVLKRAVRWGRGRFRISKKKNFWFGVPRHIYRDLPKAAGLLVFAFLTFDRSGFFRARWRFNTLLGMAIEARRMNPGTDSKKVSNTGKDEALS